MASAKLLFSSRKSDGRVCNLADKIVEVWFQNEMRVRNLASDAVDEFLVKCSGSSPQYQGRGAVRLFEVESCVTLVARSW